MEIPVNRRIDDQPWLHIILVEPQIAPNAGSIARTCAGARLRLHFIRPLGFKLDDRYLKRAGLDYWPSVELFVHDNLEDCFISVPHHCRWFCSKRGTHLYSRVEYHAKDMLIFGCEQRGLPDDLLKTNVDRTIRIPRYPAIRSYNLSNAVSIIAMEALRQVTENFEQWDRSV